MASYKDEGKDQLVRVFLGDKLVPAVRSTTVYAPEFATSREVVDLFLRKLRIEGLPDEFELVEVCYRNSIPDHESEKVLSLDDQPVKVQQEWNNLKPKARLRYRLLLREKHSAGQYEGERALLRHSWMDCHESVNFVPCELSLDSKLPDDDLCSLPKLTEETLLDHLQERFRRGRIYTYVGEILIAVNPFRFFRIYNPKDINAYTNRNLGSLPPHIFAIADVAYHRMLKEKKSQCVVISGESGSGKTESTKFLVHHLTTLGRKAQARSVEETILGVGPVLEAFGNAKTAYNNNSSRFGKFTQIKFRQDGVVCGAALRKYLLEKSRLVCQAPGERNYHVFYYLLAGASPEEKEALHLTEPADYFYLNQTNSYLEGIDEPKEFLQLKKSMDMVGFTPEIQRKIWIMLSAVLHIGNIQFIRKPGFEDSAANVKGSSELEIVSNLLMVSQDDLIDVLTTRKHKTKREQIIVPYKYEEAIATRNAIAKALYSTLFDWIVLQVNHALVIKQANSKEGYFIGVLDIFGFEDFQQNSFEQFCINFANEKLQHYFNQHVFKLEQDEYVAEGIQWRSVEFVDNFACLDLISGRPTGLFNLIDEESSFPGASESSLLDKIIKNHSGNSYFEQTLISPAFVIKHYAGNVKYTIGEFLNKNRDLMRPEILKALKHSDMRFVREILGADPLAVYRWAILRAFFKGVHAFRVAGKRYRESGRAAERANRRKSRVVKNSRLTLLNADDEDDTSIPYNEATSVLRKASRVLRRMTSNKPTTKPLSKIRRGLETKRELSVKSFDYLQRTLQRSKGAPKNPPTVSAQFQSSLNRLMEILGEAQPFFVRCMRSNAEKAPLVFDRELVLRQLRYTGMLETVRIRQLGYQWRFSLPVFMDRFSILFPNELENAKEELPEIMKTFGLVSEEYQIGKSKIFLRESQHRILQARLHLEIDNKVKVIQRWVRGVLQRRQFLQQRAAAVTIQAFFRGSQVREELAKQGWAATRIQATWRQYAARRLYLKLARGTVFLQRHVRGRLARIRYGALVKEHEQRLAEIQKQRAEEEKKSLDSKPPIPMARTRSFSESAIYVDPDTLDTLRASSKGLETEPVEEEKTGMEDEKAMAVDDREVERRQLEEAQRVRSVSKMFEVQLKLRMPKRSQRRRSSSEPNSPKSPQPSSLSVADIESIPEKPRPRSQALSPVMSPSRKSFVEGKEDTSEVKDEAQNAVATLPRKVSSSIRRRLSGRRGTGNRRSTSDVPDPRASTLARTSNIPANKDYRRPGNAKKKSFFHKMGRSNSLRKDEEENQSKPAPSQRKSFPQAASTDDLSRAMRETKIVSAVSSPVAGTHWKQAGQSIIQDTEDLAQLQSFLMTKIAILNKEENKRDTIVDVVFRKALQEFHGYIVTTHSAVAQNNTSLSMKHEDLTATFEHILKKVVKGERISASFPTTMGVNAFGGVMSEFAMARSVRAQKPHKPHKRHHHKKRKQSEHIKHNGHDFVLEQFSISTFCEHCNNRIWVLDKGLVCQNCRFTCHKKCYVKSSATCGKRANKSSKAKGLIFGADLSDLVTDEQPMPVFVEKLIQDIEKRGMFVEGIYRKSPSGAMVKSLKNAICTAGIDKVKLEDYHVLVVAAVLKLFFRQMSPSLVKEELYMEFLRATELSDQRELLHSLRIHTQKLPRAHRDVLERLVFHFARVASHSDVNLMNANALAIIWSASILRPPPTVGPLESLQHVGKQTRCLEALISGQLTKLRSTLNDIWVLDKAADTATKRLSQLNHDDEDEDSAEKGFEDVEEKRLLSAQLGTLQEQKARLAASLATMEPRASKAQESSEDLTSDECITDDDLDAGEEPQEEYAVTFDLPAAPVQLTHLTKNRAAKPIRRIPTRSKVRANAIRRANDQ